MICCYREIRECFLLLLLLLSLLLPLLLPLLLVLCVRLWEVTLQLPHPQLWDGVSPLVVVAAAAAEQPSQGWQSELLLRRRSQTHLEGRLCCRPRSRVAESSSG